MPTTEHRAPAWSGLRAQPMEFEPASEEIQNLLTAVVGTDGRVLRLRNVGDDASQMYRLDTTNAASLFLKLLAPHRCLVLQDSEHIAAWLSARGVRVAAALTQHQLPDGRGVWVFPFLAGRLPVPQAEDMQAIGVALASLHRGLASHPFRAVWRQATRQRLDRLNDIRAELAQGSHCAGPMPEKLREWASDARIVFDPRLAVPAGWPALSEPCVPLHGDLNLFNMLMHDGECTFLDFEDVCHSELPVVFDLATVFERVVMVAAPTEAAANLLNVLLHAYAAGGGAAPAASLVPVALKGLALRALCTLAASDPAGKDDEEWQKFFHLMDLAQTWQNDGQDGGQGSGHDDQAAGDSP